jgi:hypothetical protein
MKCPTLLTCCDKMEWRSNNDTAALRHWGNDLSCWRGYMIAMQSSTIDRPKDRWIPLASLCRSHLDSQLWEGRYNLRSIRMVPEVRMSVSGIDGETHLQTATVYYHPLILNLIQNESWNWQKDGDSFTKNSRIIKKWGLVEYSPQGFWIDRWFLKKSLDVQKGVAIDGESFRHCPKEILWHKSAFTLPLLRVPKRKKEKLL